MTLACGDAPIETPRLTLRRLRSDDLAFVTRIHSDPRVRRYLGSGLPLSAEESRAFLDSILASYERIALGQLAVVRKSDGETIGRRALSYMEIELPPHELPEPRAYTRPGAAPPGIRVAVERELGALRFAWRVAKHAKSNAIVLATSDQVVGVGAGQMNRVDSARLAVMRAKEVGLETRGTVCASDAFFPFRDGLDVVARAGATAAIHPGGSLRDEEVIAAADEQGMAMVVCGIRHFKH